MFAFSVFWFYLSFIPKMKNKNMFRLYASSFFSCFVVAIYSLFLLLITIVLVCLPNLSSCKYFIWLYFSFSFVTGNVYSINIIFYRYSHFFFQQTIYRSRLYICVINEHFILFAFALKHFICLSIVQLLVFFLFYINWHTMRMHNMIFMFFYLFLLELGFCFRSFSFCQLLMAISSACY